MFTNSSAILASALVVFVAPALAQSTSGVLKRTLPVGTQTHLGVQTFPNARCVLHYFGESSSAPGIKLFANDRGAVHFSFQSDISGTQQLEMDCTGDKGVSSVVPILLSSEAGASDINNDPAVTLPDVGVIQEPLGPDPMRITPAQLRAAGYPRRPDRAKTPHLFDSWAKMVTSRNTRVVSKPIPRPDSPQFQPGYPPPPDPPGPYGAAGNFTAGPALHSDWSPVMVYSDSTGEWSLPQTIGNGLDGQQSRVASWVGVHSDIPNQTILYQSGVLQEATCSDPNHYGYCVSTIHNVWPWYEYITIPSRPPPEQDPVGIPITVNEHDHIYVDVVVLDANGNYNCQGSHMSVFIHNFNTSADWSTVIALDPQYYQMACYSGGGSQYAEFFIENQNRYTYGSNPSVNYKFPYWIDDFFMFGTGWDDPGNTRAITDAIALNHRMVDSNNNVMAYFWEDYYNSAVLFQWYRAD